MNENEGKTDRNVYKKEDIHKLMLVSGVDKVKEC